MADKLTILLEAEKRGIIDDRNAAILAEARKRNLVPPTTGVEPVSPPQGGGVTSLAPSPTPPPSGFLERLPRVNKFAASGLQDIKDVAIGAYNLVRHPIQTAKVVGQLGAGAGIKALQAIDTGQPEARFRSIPARIGDYLAGEFPESIAAAESVGRSIEEVKADPLGYVLEHPFSATLDVATLGAGLGRVPKAGKLGEAAQRVSRTANLPAVPRRALTTGLSKVGKADTRAIAKRLNVNEGVVAIAKKGTPEFHAALNGVLDEEGVVNMALKAARKAQTDIAARQAEQVAKLGGTGTIDLTTFSDKAATRLKRFGVQKEAGGGISKVGNALSDTEFKVIQEMFDDVNDIVSTQGRVDLAAADKLRQRINDARNSIRDVRTASGLTREAKVAEALRTMRSELISKLDEAYPGYRKLVQNSAVDFEKLAQIQKDLNLTGRASKNLTFNKLVRSLDPSEGIMNKRLNELLKYADDDLAGAVAGRAILREPKTQQILRDKGLTERILRRVPGVERTALTLEELLAPSGYKVGKKLAGGPVTAASRKIGQGASRLNQALPPEVELGITQAGRIKQTTEGSGE